MYKQHQGYSVVYFKSEEHDAAGTPSADLSNVMNGHGGAATHHIRHFFKAPLRFRIHKTGGGGDLSPENMPKHTKCEISS